MVGVSKDPETPETNADTNAEYDRFERLTRRLLTVPKEEIDKAREDEAPARPA